MVSTCCICGKEDNQMSNRTFHKIPKKEDLKVKWFSAIGKEVNWNSTKVCSDHFNERDFSQYTNVRKRLLPNAVPCSKNSEVHTDHSVNNSAPIPVQESNTMECANSSYSVDESHAMKDHEIDYPIVDSHCTSVERGITSKVVTDNKSLSNLEDETNYEIVCMSEETVNIENNEPHTDNMQIKIRKRKAESTVKEIMQKKIRLALPNKGSGVLRRSDFMSEEAWNLFVKHIIYYNQQKKNKKLLSKKCMRFSKRITDLKSLLKNLRDKRLLTSQAVDAIKCFFVVEREKTTESSQNVEVALLQLKWK